MGSKLKPRAFIHEPYKMTYLDQKFNDFEVGVNYPNCEYGRTRNSLSDFMENEENAGKEEDADITLYYGGYWR
jgi:hypothetical protein